MLIQTLRLRRGWSQEQLALISGLSTRTVQRIERGKTASLESLKAIASAFAIDVSELSTSMETTMNTETQHSGLQNEHEQFLAFAKVRRLKNFYGHLAQYCVAITAMAILNLIISPNNIWFIWPAIGWGIAVLIQALRIFSPISLMGADWEKKTAERYLGRKL